MIVKAYRRRKASDVWHWVPRCRWYPPHGDYVEKHGLTRPKAGELCNECRAKARRMKG